MNMATMNILGDWGTTRLRLFLMDGDRIVDRADGPGIGNLTSAPADTLFAVAGPLLERARVTDMTLCGMAGSRNGLLEVPYAVCPGDMATWANASQHMVRDGIDIVVAAGLACADARDAPDVMRGEETQIFGGMMLDTALAQGQRTVVLPGTHSKWASLENGKVQQFRTWMTGELFGLLRDHSTLARAGGSSGQETDHQDGFAHGLNRSRDGDVSGSLFEARSAQLRLSRSQGWALGYLSGLLIGCEIADARARLSGVSAVTLIGDPSLTILYRQALDAEGIISTYVDGSSAAIAGLMGLRTALRGTA